MSQLQKLILAFALIACIAAPRMALAEDVKGTVRLVVYAKDLNPGVTLAKAWLMTTDDVEQKVLAAGGWNLGIGDPMWVFKGQVAGTIPLFRYSNPLNQDHFFTTNRREGDRAFKDGYVAEGVCCWVSATQQANATPLWRLLDPKNGIHFYTISDPDRDELVRNGWKLEGNEGFVWTGPTVLAPEGTR